MIKARIRWCSCRVENILTLRKLLSLWFCFLLHSILFLISQTSYLTYKIISSYELARPVMGTIFLVYIIGERAKRVRHSQVCSIENRGYIIIYIICERSEPLSRVFNDQPRDIYIDGVRPYVQNASCYFSKLKLCSLIIVRTYVTLAL